LPASFQVKLFIILYRHIILLFGCCSDFVTCTESGCLRVWSATGQQKVSNDLSYQLEILTVFKAHSCIHVQYYTRWPPPPKKNCQLVFFRTWSNSHRIW